MVSHASRLESNRSAEVIDSLFVLRVWKLSVNGLGERSQKRIEIGDLVIPAAQDMPGIVVFRIEARGSLGLLPDENGHFNFKARGFV